MATSRGAVGGLLDFLEGSFKTTEEFARGMLFGQEVKKNPTNLGEKLFRDQVNFVRGLNGQANITQDTVVKGMDWFNAKTAYGSPTTGYSINRDAQFSTLAQVGAATATGIIGFKATQGAVSFATGDW